MTHVTMDMYGISRIDCEWQSCHSWRVSLRPRGERMVKNFSDLKHGGELHALRAAAEYRDRLIRDYPPITRKEFASAKRRHNRTGITGVYRYAKKYKLKDGTERESWYWEVSWPTELAHRAGTQRQSDLLSKHLRRGHRSSAGHPGTRRRHANR